MLTTKTAHYSKSWEYCSFPIFDHYLDNTVIYCNPDHSSLGLFKKYMHLLCKRHLRSYFDECQKNEISIIYLHYLGKFSINYRKPKMK